MANLGALTAPRIEHRSTRVVVKAEYIWIDGTEPTARLRSKTKILDDTKNPFGSYAPIVGAARTTMFISVMPPGAMDRKEVITDRPAP